MSLSLTEEICYCTVRIECENAAGQVATGTGFFFNFVKTATEGIPLIVTNKHVVAGMSTGRFVMTKADKDGNPINTDHVSITLIDLQSFVKEHPNNDVDLCALSLAPILENARSNNMKIFYKSFIKSILPTAEQLDELTALEDILMIGYPNGIWDSTNNMPILRRGSTATHPCLNYMGKKEFVIDAACFPGSSGSPILIFNPSSYLTKTGILKMPAQRILLVGILYAGPQHTATGEIKVVTVPTFQQPVAFSSIPNHLGFVIKSERILELESLFE